jgi:hypothetical protein
MFSLTLLVAIPRAAHAEANFVITIAGKKNALTCSTSANRVDPSDTVALAFVMHDKLALESVTIRAGTVDHSLKPSSDGKGGGVVSFQPQTADAFKATAVTDKGTAECDQVALPPATGGRGSAAKAGGTQSDDDAYRWWLSTSGIAARDGLKRAGKERGLPAATELLVHLPSGRLVFPAGLSLREGTPVQVAVISSHASGYDVQSTDCAAIQTFRTAGDVGASIAKKQVAPGGFDDTPRLILVGVGQYLRCGAGIVSYDLKSWVGDSEATLSSIKLEMRPVYSFALITAIGFDTTISHDFEAVPTANGTGNVIAAKHDRAGPTVLVGGQWMIGGVDYTDMRWYNYVANPFLAFDASAPLAGFIAGDTLTISGGISLAIGLAVHRGTRLKGAKIGDSLGDKGDVPKEDTWRQQRLGFYIGVTVDSKIYDALKGK